MAKGAHDNEGKLFAKMPRLPMQPVIDLLMRQQELPPDTPKNEIARQLGLDHAYFARMCRDGINYLVADRLAVQRLGKHPGEPELWGDDWWELDKQFIALGRTLEAA